MAQAHVSQEFKRVVCIDLHTARTQLEKSAVVWPKAEIPARPADAKLLTGGIPHPSMVCCSTQELGCHVPSNTSPAIALGATARLKLSWLLHQPLDAEFPTTLLVPNNGTGSRGHAPGGR